MAERYFWLLDRARPKLNRETWLALLNAAYHTHMQARKLHGLKPNLLE